MSRLSPEGISLHEGMLKKWRVYAAKVAENAPDALAASAEFGYAASQYCMAQDEEQSADNAEHDQNNKQAQPSPD